MSFLPAYGVLIGHLCLLFIGFRAKRTLCPLRAWLSFFRLRDMLQYAYEG